MKNWKCKVAIFAISLIILSLLIIAFDDYFLIIKGYLFAVILMVAGYVDIKTRTIPDYVHVLIILVGLINVNLVESFIGLIIVPLPFFIMACLKENSIGGGDIKLMAASGFFLGLTGGILGAILSLVIAVVLNGICVYIEISNKEKGFALAPYISIGCVLTYILI